MPLVDAYSATCPSIVSFQSYCSSLTHVPLSPMQALLSNLRDCPLSARADKKSIFYDYWSLYLTRWQFWRGTLLSLVLLHAATQTLQRFALFRGLLIWLSFSCTTIITIPALILLVMRRHHEPLTFRVGKSFSDCDLVRFTKFMKLRLAEPSTCLSVVHWLLGPRTSGWIGRRERLRRSSGPDRHKLHDLLDRV